MTKGDRGAAVGDVDGVGEFTAQTFFDRHGTEALRGICHDLISTTEPERVPPCVFSQRTWKLIAPLLSTKLNQMNVVQSPIDIIKEFLQYDLEIYRAEALEALRNVQIPGHEIRLQASLLGSNTGGKGGGKLDCKRFFNRLGGLHVRIQQNLYTHFKQTYDAKVDEAKAENTYNGVAGVLNSYFPSVVYNYEAFDGQPNEIVHTSDAGGITRMVHLKCDAGKYFKLWSVHRVYGSTVVDISVPPPSFKLVSLSLPCSSLF